jgi:hypothetical protein
MSKWFKVLEVSAVVTFANLGIASTDSYGTCASGKGCTAVTTQYECCWGGAALQCPNGQVVYSSRMNSSWGSQLCAYYEP